MKPDLLKIRVDDNLGTSPKMPEPAWRATIAEAHARKLPIAVHVFYLADAKATLIAGADLFVLASEFEGLAVAMMEALALGLPIVDTAVPGIRGEVQVSVVREDDLAYHLPVRL